MGRGGGRTEEMKAVVETYRSAVARGELALKRSPYSSTGFTNIITIKGKFQARLQVPGDGRGGTQKRKQYALPGLFDTAEDAAIFLAATESSMRAACEGKLIAPPKQDKEHKLRTTKQPAAPQPQQQLATAFAMPLCMPMSHLPIAAASPLPMQPLSYVPQRI